MGSPGTPVADLKRQFVGEAFTGYAKRYGWRAVFDARQIRRGQTKGQWEVWFKHSTSQGLVWKRATVKTIRWKEQPTDEKRPKTQSTGDQAPSKKEQVRSRWQQKGEFPICTEKSLPAQKQLMGF